MARRYKVEAFDKMQFFYGDMHKPRIQCFIRLSGHIDADALTKAVSISKEAIPMICCGFDSKSRRPYWRGRGLSGEDIVRLTEGPVEGLLDTDIDIVNGPQLKIMISRKTDRDTLYIIVNHMVCDGGGFKEYLYLLCDLYTKCIHNQKNIPVPQCYSRGTAQLFTEIGWGERFKILFSKYDLSAQGEQEPIPLQGDRDHPFIITLTLTEEEIARIKAYAKERGATLNDAMLAAYVRILHRKTGWERIVVPCPVDLRRYIPPGTPHGICNLTGNYICDIMMDTTDTFGDTLKKVSDQLKSQKASNNCLKPVMTLELLSHIVPFHTMHAQFSKAYTVPIISYTNLGIVNADLLVFGDLAVEAAFLTGTIKYAPYFQLSISTYRQRCTLTSNMYGTKEDKRFIEQFLADVKNELILDTA